MTVKKIGPLAVLLTLFAAAAASRPAPTKPQGAATDVTRTVLVSLEPGEEIKKEESTIAVSAMAEDIVLILTKGKTDKGPFTVFRDGKRSAPVADFKAAMTMAYAGRKDAGGASRDCAVYKPGPAPEKGRFENKTQGRDGEVLSFQGKTIGLFKIVLSSRFTPDGALGYFTATNKDKAWFGCSDGRKISFGGVPNEFKFSPDGKLAAVLVQGSMSLTEMEGLAKLPPDKQMEAFKTMDQTFLYTLDGAKYGPFDKDFSGNSFWFPAGTNDFYFRVHDQIFRNGAPFLKQDSFDSCAFYPSADGKSYAYFTYEGIVFSDGTKFPAPLDIVAFQENGRTIFKWITLENKKDIVVYKRRA
jgi:hypothetical protein